METDNSKALVLLLNKNGLPGFWVMMKSFLANNPWFNHPVIVLDIDLTKTVKDKMMRTFPDTVFNFVKINKDNYKDVDFSKTADRLKATYYKLDMFSLYGYEKIVFLDTDVVVLADISELWTSKVKYIAAVKGYSEKDDSLRADINSGVVVVTKELLNENTYAHVLEACRPGFSMPDQKCINIVFRNLMEYANKSYNVEKRMENTKNFQHVIANAKIIHYVAGKPWDPNDPEKGKYPAMEAIWRQWAEEKPNDI